MSPHTCSYGWRGSFGYRSVCIYSAITAPYAGPNQPVAIPFKLEQVCIYEGDNAVPHGGRLVTFAEAEEHLKQLKPFIPQYFIVRLSGGGALSGPYHSYNLERDHPGELGHSLCVSGVAGVF